MPPKASKDPIFAGLGTTGTALVQAIFSDYNDEDAEADARERELIRAAAELRDRLTEMEQLIEADGLIVSGKPHPLLAESRQSAVALGKLLQGVFIGVTSPGKSARHQRAAAVRWSNEAKRRGQA